MFLDEILERNKRFVQGREPRPLPSPSATKLAVIACHDPRLDNLLASALGIEPGGVLFYRTAGAVVTPLGDPLRSLALAAYTKGVTGVIVVGHTSCGMKSFSNAAFIDIFRNRGVRRDAFGSEDLRAWAGAISDVKTGVRQSVATIVNAPFMPRDLLVAGVILDDATGSIEVVHQPGDPVYAAGAGVASVLHTLSPATEPSPELTASPPKPAAASAPEAPPPLPSFPGTSPIPEPPPARPSAATPAQPAAPRDDLIHAIQEVRTFVGSLEESAFWRHELNRLRQEFDKQPNLLGRLALLENFVRKAGAQSKEVAAAFERLKRETASARASLARDELVDLFWRPASKR